MQPVITGKQTYIAPFCQCGEAQYLVIEDHFPNGRPALEKGFRRMHDRPEYGQSVRTDEVTVCLNPGFCIPLQGPLGVVLGYDLFAHMLNTNEGHGENDSPHGGIRRGSFLWCQIQGFFPHRRLWTSYLTTVSPNEYLGDTNLRLAVDVSQMVGIRFGETVKAFVEKYGDASRLTTIPLGIAGWLRYLLAVDDAGNHYELAPDPMKGRN